MALAGERSKPSGSLTVTLHTLSWRARMREDGAHATTGQVAPNINRGHGNPLPPSGGQVPMAEAAEAQRLRLSAELLR